MLAALDVEVLGSVKDIIAASPQPPDIFTKLKERIIKTFAVSNEAKLRQLLKSQVLIDGKPSLILSRLRNLNVNNAVDDSILKSLFLEQLPEQDRGIVMSNSNTLDAMAELADQLADLSGASFSPRVNVVSAESSASQADIQSLIRSVQDLTVKVDALEKKSRSRSTSRARKKSNSREKPSLCYAHQKFPDNPTSCRSWCKEYSNFKKKLVPPPRIETATEVASASCRLHLRDRKTGQHFLVDSGAEVSVVPANPKFKLAPTKNNLFAANVQ
ncbi:uncharacterized protein LOC115886163 [Sitophilus oryzae]|uniref:Uncharacterized protein LOC115886163 n=1 Tax=Sitophilus oryzae TaxID=7048 RepID=A0A6J2YD29_SITOR|nr:uncharacterized protein LOC115886163 [Sitophilus oryzae]